MSQSIGRFRIIRLDSVSSTQEEARRLHGAPEFTVIVANEQRAGRGRMGRTWCSPRGGLWLTVILHPPTGAEYIHLLGLVGALSSLEAIRDRLGPRPIIRWPNDLYLDGRKVAGILLEVDTLGPSVERALLGIGINSDFPSSRLPGHVRNEATTLRDATRRRIDNDGLLLELLERLWLNYERYKRGQYTELCSEIERNMDLLNARVEVTGRTRNYVGTLLGLGRNGRLILDTDEGTIEITAPDVVKLRPI